MRKWSGDSSHGGGLSPCLQGDMPACGSIHDLWEQLVQVGNGRPRIAHIIHGSASSGGRWGPLPLLGFLPRRRVDLQLQLCELRNRGSVLCGRGGWPGGGHGSSDGGVGAPGGRGGRCAGMSTAASWSTAPARGRHARGDDPRRRLWALETVAAMPFFGRSDQDQTVSNTRWRGRMRSKSPWSW